MGRVSSTIPGRSARLHSGEPPRPDQPVVGPGLDVAETDHEALEAPRLARHSVTLDDGHEVGVAVCGRGVPLVLVHGFSAEGILYAQTLSRLVSMGFKVVAVDTAGHGGTLGLPTTGATMESYTRVLARVLDTLGITSAVLMGHSMGGRLVTELAANEPDRAVAVVLVDAIVGDAWDRLVTASKFYPPVLAGIAGVLAIDTLSTVPLFGDPRQAAKLGRLVGPIILGHARRPWRLMAPAVSIMRSGASDWMLERLAERRVPLFVIHGDRDLAVPYATARSAAWRGGGQLVRVHGASHSWLLKDPEALPGVMFALMQGRLGTARLRALLDAGVDPNGATEDEIESVFFSPDSLVVRLTPDDPWWDGPEAHKEPVYEWTTYPPVR